MTKTEIPLQTRSYQPPGLARKFRADFLTNWRLALLGLTGIVLSLASGWTTFDGISNFTKSPILSLMITFGVQGVMLVTAWLIGETFAASHQSSGQKIFAPYAHGLRTILAHLPLWTMFLTCMAISVFFSFDSLFSTIFPNDERARAGQLRAQSHVASVIADVESKIRQRRDETTQRFFASKEWNSYKEKIAELNTLSRGAANAMARRDAVKREERRAKITQRQNRVATLNAKKQNLLFERDQLDTELKGLSKERAEREADVTNFENMRRSKRQEIVKSQAEAEAELEGVGSTGHAGEGPKYRALMSKIAKLRIDVKALGTQVGLAKQTVTQIDAKRSKLRAHRVKLSTNIAKLEAASTSARKTLQQDNPGEPAARASQSIEDSKILERALIAFRQKPEATTLTALQRTCANMHNKIRAVRSRQQASNNIDCALGEASENAERIFKINDNIERFNLECSQTVAQPLSTTGLLSFARSCIQTSGLSSKDTQNFHENLRSIALARDDKAHRFVVTWNAFSDKNQLAYLALAIAIAIDSLVFMSGLFGAATTISPLKESPRARNRSIAQLQEIIDNALLPDKAYTAELALNILQPVSDTDNAGFIAIADLSNLNIDQALLMRKTLTAGSSLGLVKHVSGDSNQFLIRAELFEYLSSVRAREVRLGNLTRTPANPEYITKDEQAHPKIAPKKPAQKQPAPQSLIEHKAQGHRHLDIEETRQRYMCELLARLNLEQVDEQFLERLVQFDQLLESAIRNWTLGDALFKNHLKNKDDILGKEIDRAHRSIVDKWNEDPDTIYPISKIDKDAIKRAVIIGETLPLVRDHLQRTADNTPSIDDEDLKDKYIDALTRARAALEDFMDGDEENASPNNLIHQLEKLRFVA